MLISRHPIPDGAAPRKGSRVCDAEGTQYAVALRLRVSSKGKPRMVKPWTEESVPKCRHKDALVRNDHTGIHTCTNCGRVQDHDRVLETAYAPILPVDMDKRSNRQRKRDAYRQRCAARAFAAHADAPLYPIIPHDDVNAQAYNAARFGRDLTGREIKAFREIFRGYDDPARVEPFCKVRPTSTAKPSSRPLKPGAGNRMPRHSWGEPLGR